MDPLKKSPLPAEAECTSEGCRKTGTWYCPANVPHGPVGPDVVDPDVDLRPLPGWDSTDTQARAALHSLEAARLVTGGDISPSATLFDPPADAGALLRSAHGPKRKS